MGRTNYKNESEDLFFQTAKRNGWNVTKRGWPDFFLNKDGKCIVVEVKPSHTRSLRKEQSLVMDFLASYGIPCYKWTPDKGLIRIGKWSREKENAKTR